MRKSCSNCSKLTTCKSASVINDNNLPVEYVGCKNWQPKRPITNGDRVRSMTDEQLIDLLHGDPCKSCAYESGRCDDKSCRDGSLAWLKLEVPDVSRH